MKNLQLISILVLVSFLEGCKDLDLQKDPLHLNILNNELISYSYDLKKDTLNILEYEIINMSNDIYYVNNLFEQNQFFKNSVFKNGLYIRVFDEKNKEVKYDRSIFSSGFRASDSTSDSIWLFKTAILKNLEIGRSNEENHFWYYSTLDSKHNFFIHPKEKIFFKMYLNLTDTIAFEDARLNYAKIYNNNKYIAGLELASDSSNYRKVLPDQILKRIKDNKAKVFHGIIKSKNMIPVRVLNE